MAREKDRYDVRGPFRPFDKLRDRKLNCLFPPSLRIPSPSGRGLEPAPDVIRG